MDKLVILAEEIDRRKQQKVVAGRATGHQGGEGAVFRMPTPTRHYFTTAHQSSSAVTSSSTFSMSSPSTQSTTTNAPIYSSTQAGSSASTASAFSSSSTSQNIIAQTTFGTTTSGSSASGSGSTPFTQFSDAIVQSAATVSPQSFSHSSSSSSVRNPNHPSIIAQLGMERVQRILAMLRSQMVIQSAGPSDPLPGDKINEGDLDPILVKFEIYYTRAIAGYSASFRFGSYKTNRAIPAATDELDFGLSPKAYLYPLQPGSADAPKKSSLYENKLVSWYAYKAKSEEQVWSLKKIKKCVDVKPLDAFLGSIQNMEISVIRVDETVWKFSLADLPHMNLADIIALIRHWGTKESDLLKWLTAYLKQFVLCYYLDAAGHDWEVANSIDLEIKRPEYKFTGDKTKSYKVGEIIADQDGYGVKVYYETRNESDDSVRRRMLVVRQVHLYPTHLVSNVVESMRRVPCNNRRLKADVIEKLEWVISYRKLMLELPALCFADKLEEIKRMNVEVSNKAKQDREQINLE